MNDELTQKFIDLVKTVITPEISKAVEDGYAEIHIGFSEVSVENSASYEDSLIRPFVHITQTTSN